MREDSVRTPALGCLRHNTAVGTSRSPRTPLGTARPLGWNNARIRAARGLGPQMDKVTVLRPVQARAHGARHARPNVFPPRAKPLPQSLHVDTTSDAAQISATIHGAESRGTREGLRFER